MEAKEYLRNIKRADTIINSMMKERDQLQGMRYKITQNLKSVMVSGGGAQGGFANASDRLIDLERVLEREIDRFADLREEACAMLRQVEDTKLYEVLHRHYILYDSFEHIAVDMNYTYRNICYIHGRALQVFQKVLDAHRAT